MNKLLVGFMLVLFGANSALADVVTKCDSIQGYSYYVAGPLVEQDAAGWKKDGISSGNFLVIREANENYDIVVTDSLNRTKSSREEGGEVSVVSKSDSHLVLIVGHPSMNVETYYFRLNQKGKGELTVSQARYGEEARINKHSLMRATCSK
jgi:hypothetical protein